MHNFRKIFLDATTIIYFIQHNEIYFETPDAFNLATAVLSGCEIFLTNDKRLRKFSEIEVITVEDFNFGEQNDFEGLSETSD